MGGPAEVMVSPKAAGTFKKTLDAHRIGYSVLVEDVEQLSGVDLCLLSIAH